jgi:hypothetical protein
MDAQTTARGVHAALETLAHMRISEQRA